MALLTRAPELAVRFRHRLPNVIACIVLLLPTTVAAQTTAVWVNTKSHVYHCPGTRYYGATKTGTMMPENKARAAGNRPAHGVACSDEPDTARTSRDRHSTLTPPRRILASPTTDTKVWVNTKSHVYHCPGARYYGATKSGRFMTQTAARAAGNRPAYGAACP